MDADTIIILAVGAAMVAAFAIPYLRRHRSMERQVAEAEHASIAYGLDEPVSLHPVVDPSACIGTGNCVAACPEKDVLGLRYGQAVPVSPARCIGHGLCERSCPMEAIQLVFGSERRGVDIPRIRENFETNVPGIFVIGELGGMGLVRNAFEQGRQCIEGLARDLAGADRSDPSVVDVAIVGCGPAGLSASLNCLHHGLSFVTIEKEDVGGTVRSYPRKKLVMTRPLEVPGYGRLAFREILKEDLIALWEDIVERTGLDVRTKETVESVHRLDGGLIEVQTQRATLRARRVVLAIGRRGVPRKLGVPGETAPQVVYSLREPEAYRGDRVLVVGGGDSAIEGALALASEPGTTVHLSYRGRHFNRVKPENVRRIESAEATGLLKVLWGTTVTRIEKDRVTLGGAEGEFSIENDTVVVQIGGELPLAFLKGCGIEIDTKFGQPV